jgi:hypothetical protein
MTIMQSRPKPVIYIAFANDLEHAERNLSGLAVESANIQGALHDLCDQDASWELVPNADCTPAKLVAPFYSDRVGSFITEDTRTQIKSCSKQIRVATGQPVLQFLRSSLQSKRR